MAKEEDKTDQRPKARSRAQVQAYFPTVGIGASAGGVGTLQAFFAELPDNTGAAYVVIVHLDPTHASDLAEILGRCTSMPVQEVNRKVALAPNKVYVIPPDRRLLISDHDIATFAFDEPRGMRAPIDQFFRSLADQHGDGYAVILTGAGSDGALGVRAIKEADGIILVQDPNEAEYPSMPRSAIATGVADLVLPVRELAHRLADMIRNKLHVHGEDLVKGDEELLKRILAYVRNTTGHDFTKYKLATLTRRVARRMQVCKVETLQDYFDVVRSKPDETQNLFSDLLISVTTFFRDPAAFRRLADLVIPKLLTGEHEETPLRIWVAGCASGEEAYSITILLLDEAARRGIRRPIQIFASDIDAAALTRARQGLYPAAIETDVSEERLRRYFTREGDHYRIRREIRDLIVFANHSVLRDPPFSHIDLISCRNLLIYLERELQQQVLSTFHYAAKPGGFLFLGASEIADSPQGLFRAVDRDTRIYQACYSGEKRRELPRIAITPRLGHLPVIDIPRQATQSGLSVHLRELEKIAPPSILVNADYRVVNMSGSAGRFLQPSGGPLHNDVTELVRPELRFDLRTGLIGAIERNEQSVSLPIPVYFNGHPRRVYVQVRPVSENDGGGRNALVFFLEGQEIRGETAELAEQGRGEANGETVRLKEELEQTRAGLRASQENFEASNEELRASNEELQSLNEEYRSSAEELETSKEELQSINEELQTVNAEFKVRLESVSRSNNDLQNLIAASDTGTLFLDNGLRIKRFTPGIAGLFNITVVDEGRLITDFTHRLDYPAFAVDAHSVLKNLGSIQREVKSNGRWYLARLRPYRTEDDRIDGLVCTFVDISGRKQAETALNAGEARLKDTLAAVQAMAEQSFGEELKHPEVLQRFSKRIQALSITHELLAASNWTGASLSELAGRQLAPFLDGRKELLQLAGPEVTLPPGAATRLGLVLHELGARALEYGALSTPKGRVQLEWQVDSDSGQPQLNITWQENGGPNPAEPPKGELGTLPIEQVLAGANAELSLKSSGLECSITMPLAAETTQKA